MAAETKNMDAEQPEENVVAEEPAAEKLNYVSGGTWKCQQCGLMNSISAWNCIACYASMKKSMQKDKSLKQRQARAADERRRKRQAKREELYKKVGTTKKDEDGDDEAKAEVEVATETKAEPLKFKLSENIPKTMRALVKETAGKGYVLKRDYPVPTPKEDELLIRSFSVAICGSDNILYHWTKEAQTVAKLPFIPGIQSLRSEYRILGV